ncbi:MAG: ribonuclease R family protein [Phycisphaerae bacterium]
MMPSNMLAKRILKLLGASDYKPIRLNQLAEAIGIGESDRPEFDATCLALINRGRVVLTQDESIVLCASAGNVVGMYQANPRGFGFVIPCTADSPADVYVSAGNTGGAITGDIVTARVKKRGKRGGRMRFEGTIVGILERGQTRFVGELRKESEQWLVVPEGNTPPSAIVVAGPGAINARPGDQVVAEISRYPDRPTELRGAVIGVLGRSGGVGVDAVSIAEQYGLTREFGEAVLREARYCAEGYSAGAELLKREDLRKLTIITIDPPEAKDFDDAVSITRGEGGSTELGVHIADVSHFVREGGRLDVEARKRSTSVYLSSLVIPMLPEALSSDVCSLQERKTRLTKSVFITYDRVGRVRGFRLANSVIRCTKRLTYEQASNILSGRPGRTSAKVVALLKDMERLARRIQGRRLREGMLVLDLPEVELVYNTQGHVIDAVPADRSPAHTIIEMFMVEANEAVARLLADRGVPYLRRIHDAPDATGAEALRKLVRAMGYALPRKIDRGALTALLDLARDKKEKHAVHLAVLRSMQQARYSPLRIGHYALASNDYCHFTSPIRRYPDLTVHRLVDAHLSGTLADALSSGRIPSLEELVSLGNHCSDNERRAEAAERELRLVLVLRLLQTHIGEEVSGTVTGFSKQGVFVQVDRFLVEGLVPFDALPGGWWDVDVDRGLATGPRPGQKIKLGDTLRVVVSDIKLATRRLELTPAAEFNPAVSAHGTERRPAGRRRQGRRAARRRIRPPNRRQR